MNRGDLFLALTENYSEAELNTLRRAYNDRRDAGDIFEFREWVIDYCQGAIAELIEDAECNGYGE